MKIKLFFLISIIFCLSIISHYTTVNAKSNDIIDSTISLASKSVTYEIVETPTGRYCYKDGELLKGYIETDDGKIYYADEENGKLLSGMHTTKKGIYYFCSDGTVLKGKVVNINGKRYLFSETDGKLRKGYSALSDGRKYYSDKVTGELKTGMISINDTTTYYFLADGTVAKNSIRSIDGQKYYFGDTGNLKKGYIQTTTGEIYCGDSRDGHFISGMQTTSAGTYYFCQDGTVMKGKVTNINGKRYLFSETDGKLRKGYTDMSDGRKYYSDKTTGELKTGMITINDTTTYYFQADGSIMKSKVYKASDGKRYLFSDNGNLQRGYAHLKDGRYYYGDKETGELQTGMIQINDETTYYFRTDGSIMKSTVYKRPSDGKRFLFADNGNLQRGFTQLKDGRYYYGDKKTGELQTGMIQINDETTYYFRTDGSIMKSTVYKRPSDGKRFLFADNGNLQRGFTQLKDGRYYYGDKKTGELQTGMIQINDETTYYFRTDGSIMKSTVYKRPSDGKRFLFADNGNLQRGFTQLKDGRYYYGDKETGELQTGKIAINDETTYYFNEDGSLKSGLITIDGNKYYFSPETKNMQTGMQIIDDKKYWFNRDTGKAEIGVVYVDTIDRNYYFDYNEKSGLRHGIQAYKEKIYYFDDEYGIGLKNLQYVKENGQLNKGYDALYYFNPETYEMEFNKKINISELNGNNILSDIDFNIGEDGKVTMSLNTSFSNLNKRSQFVYSALQGVGEKYAYTDEEQGYNCSSLVYDATRKASINVFGNQNDASDMWKSKDQAKYVLENNMTYTDSTLLKPGDLIFFDQEACGNKNVDDSGQCIHIFNYNGVRYHPHHVGIYLGNGQVVEAYEPRGGVVIQNMHLLTKEDNSDYYYIFCANIFND